MKCKVLWDLPQLHKWNTSNCKYVCKYKVVRAIDALYLLIIRNVNYHEVVYFLMSSAMVRLQQVKPQEKNHSPSSTQRLTGLQAMRSSPNDLKSYDTMKATNNDLILPLGQWLVLETCPCKITLPLSIHGQEDLSFPTEQSYTGSRTNSSSSKLGQKLATHTPLKR